MGADGATVLIRVEGGGEAQETLLLRRDLARLASPWEEPGLVELADAAGGPSVWVPEGWEDDVGPAPAGSGAPQVTYVLERAVEPDEVSGPERGPQAGDEGGETPQEHYDRLVAEKTQNQKTWTVRPPAELAEAGDAKIRAQKLTRQSVLFDLLYLYVYGEVEGRGLHLGAGGGALPAGVAGELAEQRAEMKAMRTAFNALAGSIDSMGARAADGFADELESRVEELVARLAERAEATPAATYELPGEISRRWGELGFLGRLPYLFGKDPADLAAPALAAPR